MLWHILLTIVVMYVVITLFGFLLHRFFHSPSSGRLYRAHMTHHQRLYPPTDLLSDQYREPGKDNTAHLFFLLSLPLIIAPFVLWVLHLIPLSVLITAIICMLVFGGAHDYMHDAFHLRHHWLRRFKYFEKLTNIHFTHHIDMGTNYGIYWMGWDRVFRTFKKE